MMDCQNVSKGKKPNDAKELALTLGADTALTRQRRGRDPIEGLARRGLLTLEQVAVANMLAFGGDSGGAGVAPVMSWAPKVDKSHGCGGYGVAGLDVRNYRTAWERAMALKEWPVSALVTVIVDRVGIRDAETEAGLKHGSLSPVIGLALNLYVAL